MKLLGNICWLLLGGILVALIYYIVGLLMCITIIGIPFGKQFFKIAAVSFMPFGADIVVAHVL